MAFIHATTTAALFASLCVTLLPSPAAAQTPPDPITCFSCFESITTPDSRCAVPTRGLSATVSGCESCIVSIYSNVSGEFYNRGCAPRSPTTCEPYFGSNHGAACVCNTGSCNNQAFSTNEVSVECYVCKSAALIDNGCGKTLDVNSPFVTKRSGCTACELDVTEEADGSGYHRECLVDVPDTNTCAFKHDASNPGCSFRCTTNLCNAANQRRASSSLELALALLVVAALNKLF